MAIVASGMLVLILVATIAGYRRTSGARRRQVRWIAATLLFAAGATLALLTLPIVLTGRPLVARSTVSFLVLPVPIAIAIAVVRDRLFQVGLLSRSRERIVAAREEERRKLRRELHDGLAPTLAGAGIKLDLARQWRARRSGRRRGAHRRGEDRRPIRDRARSAGWPATCARRRSTRWGSRARSGSRPPVSRRRPETGLSSSSTSRSRSRPLPAAVEVAAYRIAVEALLNVVRHAAARTCEVRLALGDDALEVDVVDDGRGVAAGSTGVGTRSMQERAAEVGGEVTIETVESGGTRVQARLPVDLSPGLA